MIKSALISVWNKDGLDDLVKFLAKNNVEIISTGGTQKYIESIGVDVTPISAITGQSAVMDGRVKTLHPKIFGGILADRNNPSHMVDLKEMGGVPIDLVVVNFYPFVQEAVSKGLELKKAIEFIDIGGPSMIRASAKNYHSVIPLCDNSLFKEFMESFESSNGNIPLDIRQKWASKVFAMTNAYESSIYNYCLLTGLSSVIISGAASCSNAASESVEEWLKPRAAPILLTASPRSILRSVGTAAFTAFA